jgi:hypothetical protein
MEGNFSVISAKNLLGIDLQVTIITAIFSSPIMHGSLPFIGPAYDTARLDIQQLYPKLNISQHFILSGNGFRSCVDWATESDNALASFYYKNAVKLGANLDLTVFVMPGNATCHGGCHKMRNQFQDNPILSFKLRMRSQRGYGRGSVCQSVGQDDTFQVSLLVLWQSHEI